MEKKARKQQRPRDSQLTRERLIQAGKEEFFKKGYEQASLRRICAACGVTTGAFYFLFQGKDDLFCAIVDPVIREIWSLSRSLMEREFEDPSTGPENDRLLMEFQLAHRQEILLLYERSGGSSRESFKETADQTLTGYFTKFFAASIGREPDPEVIRLLVSMRIQGNLHILKGDFDMEQALRLNDMLAVYAEGGYERLVKKLKRTD